MVYRSVNPLRGQLNNPLVSSSNLKISFSCPPVSLINLEVISKLPNAVLWIRADFVGILILVLMFIQIQIRLRIGTGTE